MVIHITFSVFNYVLYYLLKCVKCETIHLVIISFASVIKKKKKKTFSASSLIACVLLFRTTRRRLIVACVDKTIFAVHF